MDFRERVRQARLKSTAKLLEHIPNEQIARESAITDGAADDGNQSA
jgi:hypothetical protein